MSDITYTQKIDEQTGEIKYVPNSPPPPPPQESEPAQGVDEEFVKQVQRVVSEADLTPDKDLTKQLRSLLENSKKLRYDRRLEAGKLDGRRLVDYRTSKRLFKKKAVKDRNYQFTFLIDTSGSMFHDQDGITRLQVATEAVGRTIKALEDLKIKTSVFGMNCAFRIIKDFGETLDDKKFKDGVTSSMAGIFELGDDLVNCAGGTAEAVAYKETVDYLGRNSSPKVTNVVIILSDGAPGSTESHAEVIVEDNIPRLVPQNTKDNNTATLARFWISRPDILTFGLGIQSTASQVPSSRQINDIKQLPKAMGELLTGLMI